MKTFYTRSLLAGMLLALVPPTFAADLPQAYAPKVRLAAPPKAQPFPLGDVRLLDGPFKAGQDIATNYLLSLEPDRLLANFRKEAGLKPKAEHYKGWEERGVSGHCTGHYLSACALAYAATGDQRFKERIDYMVSDLAECQKANRNGYLAAIPGGKAVFADVAGGKITSAGFDLNGCWVPLYTLHKLFAGLRDCYRLAGSTQALEVETALADWLGQTFGVLTEDQMQKVLACEHGGMNEVLADLYRDTGNTRYLDLSRKFHHKAILDPLARGEEILPGKHANTQIPKLVGLASRYEIAGAPSDRAAANFFWERVVYHHTYVTGGHCDHEHFGEPDKLNDRLSDDTTETCNVYNMLKLTTQVFGWKPESTVADFYERALLNHIRGTQHPDGRVIYNLTLKPGGTRRYQSLYNDFTCCVGTGMENHVKYGEAIYFHDDQGLWVNLFLPSELNWKQRGTRVRQETRWPFADSTELTISCVTPQEFTLRLRKPHWAKTGISVLLNGKAVNAPISTAGYAELRRTWNSGDRVALRFPMSLLTESMPDNPRRVAVFYGPTLLAANLGPVNDPEQGHPDYVPALVTDSRPISDWVKPVSTDQLAFRTSGAGRPRDVDLVPFFGLHDRRYTVFVDTFGQAEWGKRQEEIRAAREREARLAARTIDLLRIGEMQPERDHALTGDRTEAGEAMGRKWRHAVDGGWFAFEMKVDSQRTSDLALTFWGSETGRRTFDILVNDVKVGTQTLLRNQPDRFFEVIYAITPEISKGKEKAVVKLQAHPGNTAGGLFGARTLRPE